MNTLATTLPAHPAGTAPGHDDGTNYLIITVENGVVSSILPTGPVEVVIVDLDLIENDDTFEQRMRKSVLPMMPDNRISPEERMALITTIVQEYHRSGRTRTVPAAPARDVPPPADTRRGT